MKLLAGLDRSFTGGRYASGAGRVGVVAPTWAVFVEDDGTVPEDERAEFSQGIAAYMRATVVASMELDAGEVRDTFRRAARKKCTLVAVLGRDLQVDAAAHSALLSRVLPKSGAVLVEQVRVNVRPGRIRKLAASVVARVRTSAAVIFLAPVQPVEDARLTVLFSKGQLDRQIREVEEDFDFLANPG